MLIGVCYNSGMGKFTSPNASLNIEPIEDPQSKGLRILARIIARHLIKQNVGNYRQIDPEIPDSPESEDK